MTIQLQTAFLPSLISDQAAAEAEATIVIDTLRFTTTAAQALSAGANSLQAVADIKSAKDLAQNQHSIVGVIKLCGERNCKPIEGFDLGNSPTEYTPESVGNCDLVFTTTNGTRAVQKARNGSSIFLGSLTNRRVLCDHLCDKVHRLLLICSGTDGFLTAEDILTAGAIVAFLAESKPIEATDDTTVIAHNMWRHLSDKPAVYERAPASVLESVGNPNQKRAIREALASSRGGINLLGAGYEADLSLAADLDSCTSIPHSSSDGIFRDLAST